MVDRVCIELDLLVEEYIELPAVTIYVGFETITSAYYQPHTKNRMSNTRPRTLKVYQLLHILQSIQRSCIATWRPLKRDIVFWACLFEAVIR
jgi:hypothetical protein